MTHSPRLAHAWPVACLLGSLTLGCGPGPAGDARMLEERTAEHTARASELIRRQPGLFVPNLGQWEHPARFVHRSGPMTLFLEDRGWVVDLVERPVESKGSRPDDRHSQEMRSDRKIRGVALRMTFEGDARVPEILGEKRLPGHHDYFLGNDESRWRTEVPLYESVRYEGLYPGIDLRMREANRVPEYDLLLEPGANLPQVTVRVEGAQGLSIASDGSLVIATALGPLSQSLPETWQVDADGNKRKVACRFTLLGADRFGFAAPGWDASSHLTIDPGLIWSTFVGGSGGDNAYSLSSEASGAVTVAGRTTSTEYPTNSGSYDTTYSGGTYDAFVSRLDPRKTGHAQLVYSSFLGGNQSDYTVAVSIDGGGVVTVAGGTGSTNFPTTSGAFDTTHNGSTDVFVSRLRMVPLWADLHQLSVKQGGTQTLTLNGGKEHANKLYFLVGSLSGTKPGIPLGNDIILPLNLDAYMRLTLAAPNSALLTSTLGKLDATGCAVAKWNVTPGFPQPPVQGYLFHHAFVVIDMNKPAFDFASNAVPLRLLR